MAPLLLAACASQEEVVKERRAAQTAETFERELPVKVKLRYLLALPEGYDDPGREAEKWPLLMFLHGVGECGNDVEIVKRHGPPKLIEAGRKLPAIVVSPQCPVPVWQPLALNALVDELVAKLRVDESRIWLTGLSMGGFGAWATASERPSRYAALVPVCGGGDWLAAQRTKSVPTWIFHGRLDAIVPLDSSESMARWLDKPGASPKLTIYDDLGHDCWTRAYEEPELWTWLFEQRRG